MLKKILYILIPFALIVAIATPYAYKNIWVNKIASEVNWSYAIIDSSLKSSANFLEQINWTTSSAETILEFNDEESGKSIVLKTNLVIDNVKNLRQVLIEYNNKFSIKIYINSHFSYEANRQLITSETDPLGDNDSFINIYESWSKTKRFISIEEIAPYLKNGENEVCILIENVNENKKISPNKISLSILENCFSLKKENETLFEENLTGKFSNSTLPILNLNTNNKVIPDEPKIEATLAVYDNKNVNKINDSPTVYQIKIERRGHTSQTFAKKSYGFNILNNNLPDTSLFVGLPSAKKWVLYGPYADKSLIRNALTYSLYKDMGHYSVKTAFVELIINDNYQGIYILTEKININHLNVSKLNIDKNGNRSGGYLLEIDRNEWKTILPPSNDTSHTRFYYGLESPKTKNISPSTHLLIKNQFNRFEENLYYQTDSLFSYLDVNTFVDHFIISEFTKNIDAYRLSTYIYNPDINEKTPKFYMGPIWDYNFAYGLTNYNDGFNPEGFVYNSANYIPFWWQKLMTNHTFKTALKTRYFDLRQTSLSNDAVFNKIDSLYNLCKEPAKNNFKKWSVLNSKDFWPNHYLGKTYEDEINYLKDWINKRLFFLDTEILDKKNKSPLYYEIQIRNKPKWLSETKKKAKERGISIEEMIREDANYMSKK
ncbi:MAG: CotH kinase family protein [Flavobacteriales bacterium]|nr:CotH kinase family protein [Flavobacteriales bacterium]MCB9364358.1 CotH kinase family protein [Flavobacteriales bacterium]